MRSYLPLSETSPQYLQYILSLRLRKSWASFRICSLAGMLSPHNDKSQLRDGWCGLKNGTKILHRQMQRLLWVLLNLDACGDRY